MEDNEQECVPEPYEKESKHHSACFKCTKCKQTDCCYWILYNEYYVIEDSEEE